MRSTSILFLLTSALAAWSTAAAAPPAWEAELLKARAKQDRASLRNQIATLQAAADQAPKDADAQYKVALANCYLGEVHIELKHRPGAEKAAEAGLRAAQAAIAIQPKNAEYFRVLGT